MFYSKATSGFYNTQIHAAMPADVVELTDDQYHDLLTEQASGKRIQADVDGMPVAVAMPVEPSPTPGSITMRQARLALLSAGLLDAVNTGISSMTQAVQIEWEFAATVDRASPLVATLSAALELDAAALDALFTAGAAL